MMKTSVLIMGMGALLATVCRTLAAEPGPKAAPPPHLMAGLGNVHHPVSTKNKQAQQFFDQGLDFVYGFNHDQARVSFEQAAKLDPKLAMAWWGVALTLGPNYNLPVDPEREKAGYEAVHKALALQPDAPEPERAYINALAVRYSNDPKVDLHHLDEAYKQAMGKLSSKYPDDLDAATLYAESAMNLRPWKLWLPDGKPNEGTEEIVSVLESVLKRDPNHLGANHYYIHTIEASTHPERALASAKRLETLAPASGHLVHMPAHIYARVGDHLASARCNEFAAAVDKKFLSGTRQQGIYPLMYYNHNLQFLAYSASMDGNFNQAKDASARLVANVGPALKEMPMFEGYLPTPLLVLAAFEKWEDILKLPSPDPNLKITTAVWHFARGLAQANLGNTVGAAEEQLAWQALVAQIPPQTMYDDLNNTGAVFEVHRNLLLGALARSRGDHAEALDCFKRAVSAEDALNYSEPPPWFPPVRPLLGRELMAGKQWSDAEQVFRTDLQKSPRDGRALAGLRDCLLAQNRPYDAEQIDQQFKAAWNVSAAPTQKARRH
jgi:tetratricopeptide (TPR) repeat protein